MAEHSAQRGCFLADTITKKTKKTSLTPRERDFQRQLVLPVIQRHRGPLQRDGMQEVIALVCL